MTDRKTTRDDLEKKGCEVREEGAKIGSKTAYFLKNLSVSHKHIDSLVH